TFGTDISTLPFSPIPTRTTGFQPAQFARSSGPSPCERSPQLDGDTVDHRRIDRSVGPHVDKRAGPDSRSSQRVDHADIDQNAGPLAMDRARDESIDFEMTAERLDILQGHGGVRDGDRLENVEVVDSSERRNERTRQVRATYWIAPNRVEWKDRDA